MTSSTGPKSGSTGIRPWTPEQILAERLRERVRTVALTNATLAAQAGT
jgi:hypothetical protein